MSVKSRMKLENLSSIVYILSDVTFAALKKIQISLIKKIYVIFLILKRWFWAAISE